MHTDEITMSLRGESIQLKGLPSADQLRRLGPFFGAWTSLPGEQVQVVQVTEDNLRFMNPDAKYFRAAISNIQDAVARTRPLSAIYAAAEHELRINRGLPSMEEERAMLSSIKFCPRCGNGEFVATSKEAVNCLSCGASVNLGAITPEPALAGAARG